MLTRWGYEVDVAHHGQEAEELYRRALADGRPYAVVVLDLVEGSPSLSRDMRSLDKLGMTVLFVFC